MYKTTVREVPEDRIRLLIAHFYVSIEDDREIAERVIRMLSRELAVKLMEHHKVLIKREPDGVTCRARLEIIVPPTPEP